jgi:hypothetical protein
MTVTQQLYLPTILSEEAQMQRWATPSAGMLDYSQPYSAMTTTSNDASGVIDGPTAT